MANMFQNAGAVSTVKPAKAAKDKKLQVEIEDLEMLASLDATIKALTAMQATIAAGVKETIKSEFVKLGMDVKKRPDNFRGNEGNASASCEMRKRSSASKLTEAEIELLTKHSVDFDVVDDVTECYVINPAYKDDQDLLAKAAAALETVEGLPEDFIKMQAGVSRTIVADNSLDQIFRLKDAGTVANLLNIVGVLAIKPKLENADLKSAMDLIKGLIPAVVKQ